MPNKTPDPVPIAALENFKGLYNRGKPGFNPAGNSDDIPVGYLGVCTNLIFQGSKDLTSRGGLISLNTTPYNVVEFFYYSSDVKSAGLGTNFIYMTDNGSIYDFASGNLLIQWPGANGFEAIELFGRIYLSPTLNNAAFNGGW